MSAAAGPAHQDRALERSLTRWQFAGVVVLLALVVSFPLYKALEGPRRTRALTARDQALVATGRQLWALNCSSCHGDRGQGIDAPALNSKQFLGGTTDEQIHRIVSTGITGSEMPAWLSDFGGPLTDDQIAALTAYLRSWQPKAPDRPDWRTPNAAPTP